MAEKKRRWGRVSARPSEYVIKLRNGRVAAHGPGLNVFLWPKDSVAVIPTTIQRVMFVADQVTAEKVGVEVRGIAVFRVADPLLAFRVLEFDDSGAMGHVSEILRDMFVGAARRLVANMTIDACLTRRKEQIAVELMREIAPVVSGTGRPDDPADRGWGVVIDTIEIQDVRILSETVFANLQAPYRASIEMHARESDVQRDRELHLREVEAAHATHAADLELARKRSEAEEKNRLAAIERDERVKAAEVEMARRLERMEHERELERVERDAALEEARIEREAEFARRRAASEQELLEAQLDTERRRGELAAQLARLEREVENLVTPERIDYEFVTNALPALAQAMVESPTDVRVIQLGGDQQGWLTGLLGQVLALRELRNVQTTSDH